MKSKSKKNNLYDSGTKGTSKGADNFSDAENDMVTKFVRESSSKKIRVNQWTSDEASVNMRGGPNRQDSFNGIQSNVMEERLYFVNAGTHQVPLFTGFPPEDLMKAANPMGWLLSNLTTGVRSNEELKSSHSASGWLGCFGNSSNVVDSTFAEYNARRGKPILNLSPGSSAMISIADPRLRQFSNNAITKDSTIIIKEESLNKVLRARFLKHNPQTRLKVVDENKRVHAYQMFRYRKVIKSNNRTYLQAIPSNIYTETLLEEISRKFIQSISE
jgi:hypothetical protein